MQSVIRKRFINIAECRPFRNSEPILIVHGISQGFIKEAKFLEDPALQKDRGLPDVVIFEQSLPIKLFRMLDTGNQSFTRDEVTVAIDDVCTGSSEFRSAVQKR